MLGLSFATHVHVRLNSPLQRAYLFQAALHRLGEWVGRSRFVRLQPRKKEGMQWETAKMRKPGDTDAIRQSVKVKNARETRSPKQEASG